MSENVNDFLLKKSDHVRALQIAINEKDVEKIRYIFRTNYKNGKGYKFNNSEIDINYLFEKRRKPNDIRRA